MSVLQLFASRKRHGEDPEVIQRPLGTTVLYIVLLLSVLGLIAGLFPMGEDCKMSDPAICGGTHHIYPLAVIGASVTVLVIAILVWSRRQEHHVAAAHNCR